MQWQRDVASKWMPKRTLRRDTPLSPGALPAASVVDGPPSCSANANPIDVRHYVCSHKAFPQRSRSAFRIRRCGPRGIQPYLELGSFRIKSRTVMAGSGPGLSRAHPAVRLISAARTAYARRGCGRVAVTSLAVGSA